MHSLPKWNTLILPFAENTAREIDRANILHSNDSDRAARKRCISTQDTNKHGKSGLRQLYHKFQHDAQKKAVHGSDTVSEKCIDVNGMIVPGRQKHQKQGAGVCGRAHSVGAEVAQENKIKRLQLNSCQCLCVCAIALGPMEELCINKPCESILCNYLGSSQANAFNLMIRGHQCLWLALDVAVCACMRV